MSERRGTVHLTKLAVAQRQLDAAIRMTFAEEDVLAVTSLRTMLATSRPSSGPSHFF